MEAFVLGFDTCLLPLSLVMELTGLNREELSSLKSLEILEVTAPDPLAGMVEPDWDYCDELPF